MNKIDNGLATLHLGDCLESLRAMPDNSVDSIVTDPPYGLTATFHHGKMPITSVDELEAMRKQPNTTIQRPSVPLE